MKYAFVIVNGIMNCLEDPKSACDWWRWSLVAIWLRNISGAVAFHGLQCRLV